MRSGGREESCLGGMLALVIARVPMARLRITLHAFCHTIFDACNAVAELLLCDLEVLVGVGKVLNLFVELLLDLG